MVSHTSMSSKRLFITGPKWPVGIWAPPLWSMWMSCKIDVGSNNYTPLLQFTLGNTVYCQAHNIKIQFDAVIIS